MQYVRNISDSVSTAWNSINPATLSGAIDVIVIQNEDGSLQCSPFHIRFGKFSLLRPSDKKVEFKVNGVRQDFAMKLGEGGEAFFVFETSDTIPYFLQTSPVVSPAASPPLQPAQSELIPQEPDVLDLNDGGNKPRRPAPIPIHSPSMAPDASNRLSMQLPQLLGGRPLSGDWSGRYDRPHSDNIVHKLGQNEDNSSEEQLGSHGSQSPPLGRKDAYERAITLSRELLAAKIPSQVTSTGDLMLDMTGFKSSEEDAIRAEILARKILSEELHTEHDLDSLFGMDGHGNIWIYSSQDAKEAASNRLADPAPSSSSIDIAFDAESDPGYQSDSSDVASHIPTSKHRRTESDIGPLSHDLSRQVANQMAGDPNRNYAKTLRLTSDQLRTLDLRPGENIMSFTVNRATCQAYMYLWKFDTQVVISDIDGTITKSDALGHVLNMIGRDWTHSGVAKLYNDIATNGYNIMYLTSRSVGQADSTRAYLHGIAQDGFRLPRGPTILSPDRTIAALRREIYLRKPHVFKMATLRDIRSLFGPSRCPFYAGFGNRLTDQISYRTVDVPRTRIFTINSNAEVSLDLLSLNQRKMSYVNISEVVDHYFPPVSILVTGGSEEYTDFKYWRDPPLGMNDFLLSDSGSDSATDADDADEEDAEAGLATEGENDDDEQYSPILPIVPVQSSSAVRRRNHP